MGRIIPFAAFLLFVGCATAQPVPPRLSPQERATRLAEADRLASRGCYLCLKEAAAAFSSLLDVSADPVVAQHALENHLMIVLREAELQLPDSGAREAAEQLQSRVTGDYAPYFSLVDLLRPSADSAIYVRGEPILQRQEREARVALLAELEKDWAASPMKAYFFLTLLFQTRQFKDSKELIDAVAAAHPQDLSIKFRLVNFQPTYSASVARDLIGMETGFGEAHFLLGQRALLGGGLASAFRDLTRARQLLPDSAAITLALANVTFSYARYADALKLFEASDAPNINAPYVNANVISQARLGRAKSLSYLKRHDEAIAILDDLLVNDAQNNPGEKYYWRAWNRLQMGQAQLAYDDATTGLNAMRNDAIYRLAGMASFGLNRLDDSRKSFEAALQMNAADCDSVRYLGLLDSAERSWKPASARFSTAAACYDAILARFKEELAEYEKDITGLSNGLIAAKRLEIADTEALRAQSSQNAAAALKNTR